jgi:hypothetical protein
MKDLNEFEARYACAEHGVTACNECGAAEPTGDAHFRELCDPTERSVPPLDHRERETIRALVDHAVVAARSKRPLAEIVEEVTDSLMALRAGARSPELGGTGKP